MAIFLNMQGGFGDGQQPYPNSRLPEDPPPYSFFAEEDPFKKGQINASVYKYVGPIRRDGVDTIWEFSHLKFCSIEEAFEFMREHVSPDDARW